MLNRRANNRGFTIVELVLVLAILGTLLGIAVISGNALINRYRVETQIRTMYVDFMSARTNAMQKNRMYFITLTSNQYQIYEDRDQTNVNLPYGDGSFLPASDKLVMQKDLGQHGMTWNNSSTMTFDTRGLMNGSERTGRVTINFGAAYNCISISSTRIRIGAANETDCVAR